MFSSKKKNPLGKSVERFETIIGKTIRIDGNLNISEGVRIDGILNGNIIQDDGKKATVAISQSGRINGNIHGQHVIISGYVKGNIFSNNRVELLASSRIEGEITYGSIGIEVGCKILGKLNEIPQQEKDNVLDLIPNQKERNHHSA